MLTPASMVDTGYQRHGPAKQSTGVTGIPKTATRRTSHTKPSICGNTQQAPQLKKSRQSTGQLTHSLRPPVTSGFARCMSTPEQGRYGVGHGRLSMPFKTYPAPLPFWVLPQLLRWGKTRSSARLATHQLSLLAWFPMPWRSKFSRDSIRLLAPSGAVIWRLGRSTSAWRPNYLLWR